MSLHAIRAAHDQNSVIQHLQRTFHFGGKIHMPRRIQKSDLTVLPFQLCHLGKNRNAPFPLQLVCIQI